MKIELEVEDSKGKKIIVEYAKIFMKFKGVRKEVGHIFTPSGSGKTNSDSIQVCGFNEAFDLWGCALYQTAKMKDHLNIEFDRDKKGKLKFIQAKDIQLQFAWESKPGETESVSLDEDCLGCFNSPCTCDIKLRKGENPYTVKRESDLDTWKVKK